MDNIGEKQKEWLMYLNSRLPLGKTLEVVYKVKQKRMKFPEVQMFPINHRVILPWEIVIEFDYEEYETNRLLTSLTHLILDEMNIPCIFGYSGGKSFHTHIFMNPKLTEIKLSEERAKKLKSGNFHFSDLRNRVAEELMDGIVLIEDKILNTSKLDMANLYRNSLIREFGGIHEKTDRRKTFLEKLPKENEKPNGVNFPHRIEFWDCEKEIKKALQYWRPKKKRRVYAKFS